jgi:D-beta-D-heptose 7-phosphate kinase/D-beta-D-heptose 1-phosphate adenosyltransferase
LLYNKKIVAISGGFDPVHIGHIRMIREASKHGDVVVILNSDNWLYKKKGFFFMPYEDRCEILSSIKGVVNVISAGDHEDDDTVCVTLEELMPDYFANGGDRGERNTPEVDLCEKLGIEMLWNIGGEKARSSSELVHRFKRKFKT